MDKSVHWCKNCEIPVIGKKCGNCNDVLTIVMPSPLKPVFEKEYEMYKDILEEENPLKKQNMSKVLFRSNHYIVSDISAPDRHYRIQILRGNETIGENKAQLISIQNKSRRSHYRGKEFPLSDEKYIEKLTRGSIEHLKKLENEALEFIRSTINKFPNYLVMSSFSGGKDSSVTAYLVKQVNPNQKVVFSDTGIEYPTTNKYVREKGKFFGELVYLEQKNDFMELCEVLGPPSRMMRWCCSTQKATPINRYQQSLDKPILSFDGIRKEESALRADYKRLQDNTKMIKQFSAYPILDWTEFEVWLYILWRKIPFNPLYEEGYARVGCYPCPNNGTMDNFLMSYFHNKQAEGWYKFLQDYIGETGKEDDDWSGYDAQWVETSKWKGRRVKYDNEIVGYLPAENDQVNEKDEPIQEEIETLDPCKFDNTLVLDLEEIPPEGFTEFLKPFGKIEESIIGGKKFIKITNKKYRIFYSENNQKLRIGYEPNIDVRGLLKRIFRQINKAINCVHCGACIGSCPLGTISVNPVFKIDETKCNHCLTCTGTKYLKFSCVALHYRPDRKLFRKRKGNHKTIIKQ